jgi:TusA-related sulfurtransferase
MITVYREPSMSQKREISLLDTPSFVCLLKFKNELLHLSCGDLLEVVLDDDETWRDMEKIVTRSDDHIARMKKEDGLIEITIQKGGGPV